MHRPPVAVIVRRTPFAALAILMALLPLGCLEPTAETDSAPVTQNATLLPTLAEIRADVQMSDAQAEKLGAAVERWERTALAAQSTATDLSPELEFVGESATILDRMQLRQLVRVLAQHRATNPGLQRGPQHPEPGPCPGCPGDGPRHGPGGGMGHGPGAGPGPGAGCSDCPQPGVRHGHGHGGPGGGFFADLGLSAEQLQAVHAAMQTMHTALRTAREQFASGTTSAEEFQQAVVAARQTFAAALQGILTPEQYATWQQEHRTRLVTQLQRRLAHLRETAARHIELLTRILDLTPAQAGALADIHAGVAPRLEAIVAGLQDGSLTVEAAQTAIRAVHEDTHAAILSVLTPEQAELFADLRPFGHRRGLPPG